MEADAATTNRITIHWNNGSRTFSLMEQEADRYNFYYRKIILDSNQILIAQTRLFGHSILDRE